MGARPILWGLLDPYLGLRTAPEIKTLFLFKKSQFYNLLVFAFGGLDEGAGLYGTAKRNPPDLFLGARRREIVP